MAEKFPSHHVVHTHIRSIFVFKSAFPNVLGLFAVVVVVKYCVGSLLPRSHQCRTRVKNLTSVYCVKAVFQLKPILFTFPSRNFCLKSK